MDFLDRLLICGDCGKEFIFTAGEQLFFFDKQFKNDPKRCKPCKGKRITIAPRPGSNSVAAVARTETRTECSTCGVETTVPFKPTQGRPVLCRQCFQRRQGSPLSSSGQDHAIPSASARIHSATAELIAAASGELHTQTAGEMAAAPVRI